MPSYFRLRKQACLTTSKHSSRPDTANPQCFRPASLARDFAKHTATSPCNFPSGAIACVPKIPLPERRGFRARPMAGRVGFPVGHALFERTRREFCGRAKEMNVIRHEHISPDHPGCSQPPCLAKHRLRGGIRKHRLASRRADGQKYDGRHVEPLVQSRMRGMSPTGFAHAQVLRKINPQAKKIPLEAGRLA